MSQTHDEEMVEIELEQMKAGQALEEGKLEESFQILQSICDRMDASVNFGPLHEDTLEIKMSLGKLYVLVSDFEKAKKVFEKVVESKKAANEEDDTSLLAKFCLAECLEPLGQPNEALEAYLELLPLQKARLGEDHPQIIVMVETIAEVNWTLKKYEDSLEGYKTVLEKQLRDLGPDHFDTTKTKMWVAILTEKLGRIEESWTVSKEIYASHKRMYGKRGPQTLATRSSINGFLERNASSGNNLPKKL